MWMFERKALLQLNSSDDGAKRKDIRRGTKWDQPTSTHLCWLWRYKYVFSGRQIQMAQQHQLQLQKANRKMPRKQQKRKKSTTKPPPIRLSSLACATSATCNMQHAKCRGSTFLCCLFDLLPCMHLRCSCMLLAGVAMHLSSRRSSSFTCLRLCAPYLGLQQFVNCQ